MSDTKTSPASEVYESYKAHQERLRKTLSLVEDEKSLVRVQYEEVIGTLADAVAEAFPTLDELPLNTMTQASRLRGIGVERDFVHLVAGLRHADATNKKALAVYQEKHGSLVDIQSQRQNLEAMLEDSQASIKRNQDELDKVSRQRDMVSYPLRPIIAYELHTERKFDSGFSEAIEKFSAVKYLTDADWRQARAALKEYKKRGGTDIDTSKNELEGLDERISVCREELSGGQGREKKIAGDIEGLSAIETKMKQLIDSIKGEEGIHRAVCESFADMLQHESISQFLGKELPVERSAALMEATLKLQNLQALYDNLEKLRTQTEGALNQLSRPIEDLRKMGSRSSRSMDRLLEIDLESIDGKLDGFNKGAELAVARSAVTRNTVSQFNARTADTSSTSESDPFLALKIVLLNMWMQNVAAEPSCHHSHSLSHDFSGVTQPLDVSSGINPSSLLVDGSNIDLGGLGISGGDGLQGGLDLGSTFSQSISVDSPPSDVWDGGGGYSGGSDGGGGGGGFVVADIANDIGMAPKKRRGAVGFELR